MDKKVADKKERLLAALEQGMVMIHLDARRPRVLVPADLRNESHLRLNLSYRFEPSDLSVNDWGVRSTLSFSGTRFTVAVPWSALFAIASHVNKELFWTFPDDMPPELLQQTMVTSKVPVHELETVPPPAEPRPRAVLREVPGQKDLEPPSESVPTPTPSPSPSPDGQGPGDEPPTPTPRRGHLRLVK